MTQQSPDVAVGQVWADNDPRSAGRTLRVIAVGKNTVRCTVLTAAAGASEYTVGRTRMIAQSRFRPTSNGYRLLEPEIVL